MKKFRLGGKNISTRKAQGARLSAMCSCALRLLVTNYEKVYQRRNIHWKADQQRYDFRLQRASRRWRQKLDSSKTSEFYAFLPF